jgi:hypothetical protein
MGRVGVIVVGLDRDVALTQVHARRLFEGGCRVEDDSATSHRASPFLQGAKDLATVASAPRLRRDEHALDLRGVAVEQAKRAAGDGVPAVVGDENDASGGVGSKRLARRPGGPTS